MSYDLNPNSLSYFLTFSPTIKPSEASDSRGEKRRKVDYANPIINKKDSVVDSHGSKKILKVTRQKVIKLQPFISHFWGFGG